MGYFTWLQLLVNMDKRFLLTVEKTAKLFFEGAEGLHFAEQNGTPPPPVSTNDSGHFELKNSDLAQFSMRNLHMH